MAKTEYPSDKADQYMVRFPEGMRDDLKRAAAANNRSMNAEIIARLQQSFELNPLPLRQERFRIFNEATSPEEVDQLPTPSDLLAREVLRAVVGAAQDAVTRTMQGLQDGGFNVWLSDTDSTDVFPRVFVGRDKGGGSMIGDLPVSYGLPQQVRELLLPLVEKKEPAIMRALQKLDIDEAVRIARQHKGKPT